MNLEKQKNEWDNILERYSGELMGFDLKSMSDEELDRVRYFGCLGGSLRGLMYHHVEMDLAYQKHDREILERRKNSVKSTPKYGPDYTTDLRIEIRVRDGNTCLNPECRNKLITTDIRLTSDNTETLVVHHIDYDGYNNYKRNLITICSSCNNKARKNSVYSEWWAAWYQAIMYRRGNL